jgi:hypothetical protein
MAFKIGKNFHIIHMTDNLKELDAWYYDVFSCQRFMPDSYMPAEKRDASLVLIGDLCIEPLAPSFHVEGWDEMPLGRYFNRAGKRFHSLAWYTASPKDTNELFQELKTEGVRVYGTGGISHADAQEVTGAIFAHPRDMYTQLEFMAGGDGGFDPRFREGWSPSWWADRHPLGLERFSHATISTNDVDEARDKYVKLLNGQLLHEGENKAWQSKSAFVLVGDDLLVEFAQPQGADSPIAKDMERHHESIYSITFRVKDLAKSEEYLSGKGVRFTSNDGTTMVSDPESTQGCVMAFSTWAVPGDPRPSWSKEA